MNFNKKRFKKIQFLLIALCFFAVGLELFAHTLKPIKNDFSSKEISVQANKCPKLETGTYSLSCSETPKNSHPDKDFCQDEILHHLFLMTSFNFEIPQFNFIGEKINSLSKNHLSNSLAPPNLPPKFA